MKVLFDRNKTAILLASAIVVGIAVLTLCHLLGARMPEIAAAIGRELGTALLVAGILGFCIDLVESRSESAERRESFEKQLTAQTAVLDRLVEQQNELALRVGQDVFKAIYRVSLGQSVINELERALLLVRFKRSKYKYQFRFREPDLGIDPEQWVAIEIKVSQLLENMSDIATTYKYFPKVDDVSGLDFTKPRFVSYRFRNKEMIGKLRTSHESASTFQLSSLEEDSGIESSLVVRPEEAVTIEYTYVVIKPIRDHEFFYSFLPCEDLVIDVLFEEQMNMAVNIVPIHTQSLNEMHPAKQNGLVRLVWELPHGMLPYQGFELQWRKKDEVS